MNESLNPLISVVVVTWNAKRYVDECVRSLGANTDLPAEFIVVDNASTDGTPELIEQVLPKVRLIRNQENLGFAKANNIGIAQSRGKYLFLVNSDVTIPKGCMSNLVAYMEANPDVGMTGPRMLGTNGEVRRSTMRFPTVWNQFCRAAGLDAIFKHSRWAGGFLMADFPHSLTSDVEVLNGWFWVVLRDALQQVGVMDERFVIYGEDIDWCYRFFQAGWRRVFFAGAAALHYGGASSAAAPVRFHIEMQKANAQFWDKHHGALGSAAFYGMTIIHEAIRVLGHGIAYLLRPRARAESAHKVRRSMALLRWLARNSPTLHVAGSATLARG